jgi:predicted thioredoxin/glutaredoxin
VSYGVMSTPGVVIDGKVVHTGGVPSREKVEQWLESAGAGNRDLPTAGCCGGAPRTNCCG